jgi:uncharacterized protein (DUF1330 family)
MPKGYWITIYHSVSDPARLSQYAALATPAIEAGGGRILARGAATATFELGGNQRTVVIEFDSTQQAIDTYHGAAYQTAANILKGAAIREVRIIEGVG